MIHRSSSSRRRKSPTSTTTSPQSSSISLSSHARRKSGVVALNGTSPRDDKEVASGSGVGGGSSGGRSSTLDGYRRGRSSGCGSNTTVVAAGECDTSVAMFSISGGSDEAYQTEAEISLGVYLSPSAQKTPSSAATAAALGSVATPDEAYSIHSLQGSVTSGSYGANTSSTSCKSRKSLSTDAFHPSRSPRSSLVPEDGCNRGSRGSIDPSIFLRGSRNSLMPDSEQYNRSSRPSMGADATALRNLRGSFIPDFSPNRSPRNSLIPADLTGTRSGVNMPSVVTAAVFVSSPEGTRGLSRCSLLPELASSNRSPRNSLVPESNLNRTSRGSLVAEPLFLSTSRTPRGSVTSEGSMYSFNRCSRNSLPLQDGTVTTGKSPRGSIASVTGVQFDLSTRTPRGSVESVPSGINRITSQSHRCTSPFHSGSLRGNPSTTSHLQNDNTNESRRASSNVSQVSADDRRHLCEHTKLNSEAAHGLTAYGSFVYQLNHANMESSSALDFVLRALTVVYRTVIATVLLACITLLPLIMLIMGSKFIRDCPKEPHIAVYMVVGGCFGLMKMLWLLWGQIKSLRYERLNPPDGSGAAAHDHTLATSVGTKIGCFALTAFLLVWFLFGNYWIWRIYWPDHEPTLYKPDNWCHRTLYVFAVVHLAIIYSVLLVVSLFVVAMAAIQLCVLRCK